MKIVATFVVEVQLRKIIYTDLHQAFRGSCLLIYFNYSWRKKQNKLMLSDGHTAVTCS